MTSVECAMVVYSYVVVSYLVGASETKEILVPDT